MATGLKFVIRPQDWDLKGISAYEFLDHIRGSIAELQARHKLPSLPLVPIRFSSPEGEFLFTIQLAGFSDPGDPRLDQ